MAYIIDFLLLAIIYFMFFYKKWRSESFQFFALKSVMYIYVSMVLFVTLMPFPIPFYGKNNLIMETVNLVPFRDLMKQYNGSVREIFLNIIMLVPFGFLLPMIKKNGLLSTVAFGFLLSLSIESMQLASAWWGSLHSRTFDVTDLFTNTFGALVGYCLYKIFIKRIF